MAKEQARGERIVELVELGQAYMDDGAWLSAAHCLEEAAKLLREGQAELNGALARLQDDAR